MYRRRQAVALLVVLIPLGIVGKALLNHRQAAPPVTSPSVSPAAVPASSAAATAAKVSPTAKSASPSVSPTKTAAATSSAASVTADCRNSALAVTVTTDSQSYAVGSPVTIAMRISNTGGTPCRRDVGALPNEVWVTDAAGLVVWSSDACQTAAKPQVVVMPAKSVFGNTQIWSGTNSGRDCTAAAADATAGSYFAHARNDTVQAKPYAFTIG